MMSSNTHDAHDARTDEIDVRDIEIPTDALPLLPFREGVLFPSTIVTAPVGRSKSLSMLREVNNGDLLVVGVQRDAKETDPALMDLFPIGTLAKIQRIQQIAPRRYHFTLQGIRRVSLERMLEDHPYWKVEVSEAQKAPGDRVMVQAAVDLVLETVEELEPTVSDDAKRLLDPKVAGQNPGRLADVVAASLGLPADKEIEVLLELDLAARLRRVLELLREAKTLAEIKEKIASEMQGEMGRQQREVLLRQQLKAIQKELGDDEGNDDVAALEEKLQEAGLPEEVQEAADRELGRLKRISPQQAEHNVIRNYLELIAELPWSKRAELNDDLDAVAEKLDADHYGLEDVKKRILEHLAVRKMTQSDRGAILSLVGPPGTGKTSLGQSIADATSRPFVRVSLGGVRDEAEIRGHRRTYVGALPGRILAAIRKAGAKNPILLLDEIDKLGLGWMGSPEAALLEVLDPEQNHTFTDHYLEQPFDLSEVLFICTANTMEGVSAPLRDRLEMVELQGYTRHEKRAIARNHLLPEVLEHHGLTADSLVIPDESLDMVIGEYTREAGVRQLKRELTRICRAVTLEAARKPEGKVRVKVEPEDLNRYLGKAKFWNEVAERTAIPGVATGLAYTPSGGDVLFVETSRMPGKGRLEITGQLGEVMKESAQAALSYVRSHADELGVDPEFREKEDLHIHVPAGAIPKDGPSAGVTMFTALTSLLARRRVRSDTAMTGEVTLRGRVLPVGGIKAKVLAARRAGLTRVILPDRNQRDLDEVPEEIRDTLELIFASDMSEVLAAALEAPGTEIPVNAGLGDPAEPEGEETPSPANLA